MPPQADLETLVTACTLGASDGKTACETTLDDGDPPENDAVSGECSAEDLPPGSFWLSKDAEYDWFEHRSYCYERDDSTKGGNYNSKNPINNNNPSSNSNSQRFSVNLKPSKAPIIGLPHNIQKATFVDPKQRIRCSRASVKLFPTTKRVGSSGKSTGQLNEPGSPKVSCMGRVRSKRCRRMRSNSVKSGGGGDKAAAEGKKPGFCSRVLDMFRSKKGRRCKKASLSGSRRVVGGVAAAEEKAEPTVVRRSVSMRADALRESEPPGLGGMKRFSSGRRSCSDLTGGDEVVRLGR